MLLDALAAEGKPGLITDVGGASDHLNFELGRHSQCRCLLGHQSADRE